MLLEFAEAEARILLTLDKDFWQIAMQRRMPLQRSGVVLFRVHPATPETLSPLVRAFFDSGKIWSGHLTIVTPAGIQMLSSRPGSAI